MNATVFKEFENGCRVRLTDIDPDLIVDLWLPEEGSWRYCGNFDPNSGILFCKRFSRHRHKLLNSWGISAYVIETLEEKGLKLIVLEVEDTRERFEVTLEKLKVEAIWKWWREGGFDRQAFVPIPLWSKKK